MAALLRLWEPVSPVWLVPCSLCSDSRPPVVLFIGRDRFFYLLPCLPNLLAGGGRRSSEPRRSAMRGTSPRPCQRGCTATFSLAPPRACPVVSLSQPSRHHLLPGARSPAPGLRWPALPRVSSVTVRLLRPCGAGAWLACAVPGGRAHPRQRHSTTAVAWPPLPSLIHPAVCGQGGWPGSPRRQRPQGPTQRVGSLGGWGAVARRGR